MIHRCLHPRLFPPATAPAGTVCTRIKMRRGRGGKNDKKKRGAKVMSRWWRAYTHTMDVKGGEQESPTTDIIDAFLFLYGKSIPRREKGEMDRSCVQV